MKEIIRHIEAIIFASPTAIRISEIMVILRESLAIDISKKETIAFIETIEHRYSQEDIVWQLVKINGGYQLVTKPDYHETLQFLQSQNEKKKISQLLRFHYFLFPNTSILLDNKRERIGSAQLGARFFNILEASHVHTIPRIWTLQHVFKKISLFGIFLLHLL